MEPSRSNTTAVPRLPTILVVDDELGYRDGIRRILRGRGFQAQAAGSGDEALALIAQARYPIVLVDLKMPGMDGFELIRRIRELRPDTLCIVVSAFATVESAVQTTKMGAFDFVVKPFVPEDLMVVVNRAAEKWTLSQEADRLRAEREAHLLELAAEKGRLRTIIQAMGDGVLVVNIDGNIVLDNPVARRLLHSVQIPSLSGRLDSAIDDPRLSETVRRLLSGGGEEVGAILEIHLPSTEARAERFLRATVTSARDAQGQTLGVVVILSDITDAKALERAKTLFVSLVAHELKAPVGAVEGYLRMMADGSLDGQADRLKQIAGRCLERTGALLCLIQDLLEITRRDASRKERLLEPLDLKSICQRLLEFHRPEAERGNITITCEAPATLPPLHADRNDIERMITNILSNAIKYNRPGGSITVQLRATPSVITFQCSDSGIGMSPDERARIGEEFFRAKNSKTRSITGTGLGMSLVKKIVENYNGALEVESTPDVGSTFRILLPVNGDEGSPS
ncbi:MAG: response regulator [Planctomycetes bacterium]|nr:response regulator [Planctomycetota bacterium]